jgi:hypothetical protein
MVQKVLRLKPKKIKYLILKRLKKRKIFFKRKEVVKKQMKNRKESIIILQKII